MFARSLTLLFLASLAFAPDSARAQDFELCFATSERAANGEKLTEEEKRAGHEACQRALAQTSSVTQKYQLQEADFDIVGRPPKPSN